MKTRFLAGEAFHNLYTFLRKGHAAIGTSKNVTNQNPKKGSGICEL